MPRDLSHSRDAQALFLSPRNTLAPQGNIYRLRRQIRGMIVFGSCRQPNYQVIYARELGLFLHFAILSGVWLPLNP